MYLNITNLNSLKNRLENTYNSMKKNLPELYREISSINNNLISAPLADVNSKLLEKIGYSIYVVHGHLKSLVDFMDRQIKKYEEMTRETKEKLASLVKQISDVFDENGNVSKYISNDSTPSDMYYTTTQVSDSPSPQALAGETYSTLTANNPSGVDISVYSNKPESGFVVTTGNATFNLSDEDRDYLYAVVAAESDNTYDDALGVSSVVLNRCTDSAFVYSNGSTVVGQLEAPGQFYGPRANGGRYTQFLGGKASPVVKKAVDDALNGVRNHNYLYYRSNASTSYSSNMITPTGNRYGYK